MATSTKNTKNASVPKLPENMSLDSGQQKEFRAKIKYMKSKRPEKVVDEPSGVIYVGHIPRGFYEAQMKAYFTQFGAIKRLRVSRSKKTGNCKGYAFVEFKSEAVAKIVSETMNNYLMFHKLLKCEFRTPEQVHAETFKGANKRFTFPKAHLLARQRNNNRQTPDQKRKSKSKVRSKKAKMVGKLAEMGIDFELPEELKSKPPPSKRQSEPEASPPAKRRIVDSSDKDQAPSEKQAKKTPLKKTPPKKTPLKNTPAKKSAALTMSLRTPQTRSTTPKSTTPKSAAKAKSGKKKRLSS